MTRRSRFALYHAVIISAYVAGGFILLREMDSWYAGAASLGAAAWIAWGAVIDYRELP